jgi:superfamily I DNA/RNA helicase
MFGNDRQWKNAKYQLAKTVSLAKGYLASSPEEIDDIMDLHEIEPDQLDRQSFIKAALDTLKKCKEVTSVIDFDDMIWFPHVHAIKIPQYDRIFVDEAQDLNKAQIELILKTIKQPPKKKTAKAFSPSRIMAIGDRNQSLYGFRGADTKAIDNIINALGAKTLPLSVTYRCPIRVVQEARKLVPALESAPQAKAGKLDWITDREMFKLAQPGCFILSRTNAPMISLAMHFLKHRIPCNIQGRDIGLNLLNLIKLSKASFLKDFLSFLDRWSKAEMQRLQEKNKDTSQIADKVACFEALSEGCETLAELKATIEKLFDDTDDRNRIILSTVHRAKGLERDTVFVLNYTFVLGNSQEEKNIKYVAITRAKQELYFVYADKAEQPANEME